MGAHTAPWRHQQRAERQHESRQYSAQKQAWQPSCWQLAHRAATLLQRMIRAPGAALSLCCKEPRSSVGAVWPCGQPLRANVLPMPAHFSPGRTRWHAGGRDTPALYAAPGRSVHTTSVPICTQPTSCFSQALSNSEAVWLLEQQLQVRQRHCVLITVAHFSLKPPVWRPVPRCQLRLAALPWASCRSASSNQPREAASRWQGVSQILILKYGPARPEQAGLWNTCYFVGRINGLCQAVIHLAVYTSRHCKVKCGQEGSTAASGAAHQASATGLTDGLCSLEGTCMSRPATPNARGPCCPHRQADS